MYIIFYLIKDLAISEVSNLLLGKEGVLSPGFLQLHSRLNTYTGHVGEFLFLFFFQFCHFLTIVQLFDIYFF